MIESFKLCNKTTTMKSQPRYFYWNTHKWSVIKNESCYRYVLLISELWRKQIYNDCKLVKTQRNSIKRIHKSGKKSADLETTKKNNNRPGDGSLKLKQNNKYWISFRWVFSGGVLKRFFQAFQYSQSTFFLSFFYFYQRTSNQLVSPLVNWRSPLLIFRVMEPDFPPLPTSLSYMLTKG